MTVNILESRIEEAALNSWPALQQMFFDGWVMRFSAGYTKRANSVNLLYPSFLSTQEKITVCEKLYRHKQLPTIFRLTSFSPESQALDELLAQRAYRSMDLTHVLAIELVPGLTDRASSLHNVSLATWLPLFCQLSHSVFERHQTHYAMLERIVPEPFFAVLQHAGIPVACGLGVLDNELFGLFDIVTDPEQRRQGHATRLIAGMLDWATQNGAQHAYLQVVGTNQVARHMYARLGFQELYHYWYRVQSL